MTKAEEREQIWIVWEITSNNFKEVMRTNTEWLANNYAELNNKLHDHIRYEVTKAGDTPVW